MDDIEFFGRLEFPDIWSTEHLYPDELRSAQEKSLKAESPGKVYGSEHYRYAAFVHYVKSSETSETMLAKLIGAAAVDHDDVMAQAAIIDLASHKNCTKDVYEKAREIFCSFSERYFSESLLERAYYENIPSWE